MHMRVYMYSKIRGGQKRVLDPLELESQVAVSCLGWLLGIELKSCENRKLS